MDTGQQNDNSVEGKPKRDVKDTLSRLRNKKALEKASDTVPDEGTMSNTPPVSSTSAAERRKVLLKQRQQSRTNIEESSDVDQSNKRTNRQGPRSPLKSAKSSKGRSQKGPSVEDEDDDEEDEEDEAEAGKINEKETEEEEVEQEILDIVQIERPQQVFPISFLPKWRADENKLYSSVLIPPPHPDVGPYCSVVLGCLNSGGAAVCSCIGCESEQYRQQRHRTAQHTLLKSKQYNENDFVHREHTGWFRSGSTDELYLSHWIAQQKVADEQLLALGKQIKGSRKSRGDSKTKSKDTHAAGATQDEAVDDENSEEIINEQSSLLNDTKNDTTKKHSENGVYAANPPTLAHLLLRGEAVALPIVGMTAADLNLSRVTQRTLRELKNVIEEEKIRQQWSEIKRRKPSPEEGYAVITESVPTDSTAQHMTEERHIPSQVSLLRQLTHAPMLQLIENPVDYGASQPVLPHRSSEYGGQLGQWGDDATLTERIGSLPVGWKEQGKRGSSSSTSQQRAILRVHLHQLILSDHSMMSAEERRLVVLKISYSQYRALFEQRILQFLMTKLTLLIDQCNEVKSTLHHKREVSDEDILHLKRLYHDLVDTLPALNELNVAVDKLTVGIYEGWREIVEIRRKTGIVNTTANLTARPITSNLHKSASHVAEDREDGEHEHVDSGGDQVWDALKTKLMSVPALIEMVQQMIYKDDLAPIGNSTEGTPRTLGVSASAASIHSNNNEEKIERQVKLQAKLAKAMESVTEAVNGLVESQGLLPKFALCLNDDGAVTPDSQLSAAEIKRRAYLNNCKYRVAVNVNGKTITSSENIKLKATNLSVDFKRYFEFRLLHQPYDVTLDIYCSKVNMLDSLETLVASVSVPIPGMSHSDKRVNTSKTGGRQNVTHSYAPIAGWYSFAGNISNATAQNSMLNISSLFGGDTVTRNGDFMGDMRRTEGAILCTTEYDSAVNDHHGTVYEGIRNDETALVPHMKSSTDGVLLRRGMSGQHGHITSSNDVDSKVSDFTRENDFQYMLPDYTDLDLNDPMNDHLLYVKSKRSIAGDEDVFRLNGLDFAVPFSCDNVSYANYVKLKECSRMKLLRLRTLKPYLFSDPIPLSETAIKNSELYKKILNTEAELASSTTQDEDGSAQLVGGKESIHTHKVNNFLTRVRNSQTALHRNKRKKKLATSSVVIETDYLQFEELDLNILLERKRSLRPKVKTRAAVSIQIDSCELLVQVVGARNIPLRSEFDSSDVAAANKKLSAGVSTKGQSSKKVPRRGGERGGAGSESEGEGASDADNLILRRSRAESGVEQPIVSEHMLDKRKLKEKRRAKTFVEVRFQENLIATTSYDGGTPMWKQSIALPFRPPQDDFSPSNLDQLREDIHFTLFDEVIEDDAERGGFLEGENTSRVEKRYLGSCSVPFTTLFHEGRIEGVFRMDTPAINFGYDHTSSSASRRTVDDGTMFVTDADPDVLPSARRGGTDPAPIVVNDICSATWWLMDCLWRNVYNRTMAVKMIKNDSLFYDGSYIHRDTQSEFAYFAADDKSTYIKLLMTFDPILVTAPTVEDDISSTTVIRDDRYLVHYHRMWQDSIHAIGVHTKDRPYKLFGTNSSGLNVLICRYLTPQKPPVGFESRRSVLHLTSMMPFMKDAQSFIGELDLWCTTKQFWEIGAGDEEEHATLLYNYLYHLSIASGENKAMTSERLDKKTRKSTGYPTDEAIRGESVFLVMGKAIPEGETTYILLRDARRKGQGNNPENFLIINPCSGYVYSAMDPNCPLKDIYCIATPYNIWGNIQLSSQPCEMKFDVFNVDMWRPFFGQRLKPPTGGLFTVQEDIEYTESSASYALEVEKGIYTSLRNSIRRWRSKRQRSTTTFHPDACSVMHELLPSLEQWKRSGGLADTDVPRSSTIERGGAKVNNKDDYNTALERLQSEARDRMKTLLRTRTLKGCPINVPFTDIDEIVNKMKTLCIHEAQHPEVQFVMAVRAFPLYNNVLSVWIFLGTLETI